MPVALNFSQRADATKPASERAFFCVSFADSIDYWCLQALAALGLNGSRYEKLDAIFSADSSSSSGYSIPSLSC